MQVYPAPTFSTLATSSALTTRAPPPRSATSLAA